MHAPSSYIEAAGPSLPAINDHLVQGYHRHTNYSPLSRSYLMDASYAVDNSSDEPRNSHLHTQGETIAHPLEEANPSERTGPNASFRDDIFRQLNSTSDSTLPRPILPLSNQIHPHHVYQQNQDNCSRIHLHQTSRHFPIDCRYQHLETDTGSLRNDYGTSRSEHRGQPRDEQQRQIWRDKDQSEDHIRSQHQQQIPHGASVASFRWLQNQTSIMNNQDMAASIFRQTNRHETRVLQSPLTQYSRNTEPDRNIPGYQSTERSLQAQPTDAHCPKADTFRKTAPNMTIHPAKQPHSDEASLQGMNVNDHELNDHVQISGHRLQERALDSSTFEEHQIPRIESSPWNGAATLGTENQLESQKGSHTSSSRFSLVNLMCHDEMPQTSMQTASSSNLLCGSKGHSQMLSLNSHTDDRVSPPTTTGSGMDDVIRINGANRQNVSTRHFDGYADVESCSNNEKRKAECEKMLDASAPLKPLAAPDPVIDFAQMDLPSLKLYQQRFGIPAPLRRCHTERPVRHADLARLVARHFKKEESWPWISRSSIGCMFGSRPQTLASRKRLANDPQKKIHELDEAMNIEQDRVRDIFIKAVLNQRDTRAYYYQGSRNLGSLGKERELSLDISEAIDSDETSDDMDIDIENDSDVGTTLNERYFSNVLIHSRNTSSVAQYAKKAQKAEPKLKGTSKSGDRKNSNTNVSSEKMRAQTNAFVSAPSTPLPAPPTAAILRRQSAKRRNPKAKEKPTVQPSDDAKILGLNNAAPGISTARTASSSSTTPSNPGSMKSLHSSLNIGAIVTLSDSKLIETGDHQDTKPVDKINRAKSAYDTFNAPTRANSPSTAPTTFSTPAMAPHAQHPSQIPRQMPWSVDSTPSGDANNGNQVDEDAPGSLPPRVIYVGGVGNGVLPGRSTKEWGMS